MAISLQNHWVRAAKIAGATLIALLLGGLLGNPDRVSATFVAVLCCSPAVSIGMKQGFQQLGASLTGGGLGTLCTLLGLDIMLGVPLATSITVLIMALTGLMHGIAVGAFTALFVQLVPFGSPLETWWTRQEAILIALTSAACVNIIVSAAFYPKIFDRRLAKVKRFIRALLKKAQEEPRAVEPGFRVLEMLLDELRPVRRELQLRRAPATDAHLADIEDELERLKRILHEIFALGLQLEDHPELSSADMAPLIGWVEMTEGSPPSVPKPLQASARRLIRAALQSPRMQGRVNPEDFPDVAG